MLVTTKYFSRARLKIMQTAGHQLEQSCVGVILGFTIMRFWTSYLINF